MVSATDFQRQLMLRLLRAGRRRARRYILSGQGAHRSRTLATEMETRIETPERGYLYVDPYWALYFHDGRRPIVGKNMVWFKNPKLDPRLNNGRSPNRASQVRRLNKAEFDEARRLGQIVVRRRVRGVRPTPFFSNQHGMLGFAQEASKIVQDEFQKFTLGVLKDELFTEGSISVSINA